MTVLENPCVKVKETDPKTLLRILDANDDAAGFKPDPTATARRARERMLADGVTPERNILSSGIIAMREE